MSPHAASSDRGPGRPYFPGLDSLRFLAALFVVIGHIPLNQESVGLPSYSAGTWFYRGSTAVSFFFTLSGFLITFLLLDEHDRTGTVSVRRFYVRRVLRIWPVYFAVIFFGLLFYNALLPALSIRYTVKYTVPVALGLYTVFLPNLMNSLYSVGGILNPTWSIGVEEQFYLAWAPAFRRSRPRLNALCWTVLAISLSVALANHSGSFGTGWIKKFVDQLEFHYMAAGGLCAAWLHGHRERFLALPVFRSRWLQALLAALLLDFYFTSLVPWGWAGREVIQLVLYGWLIVTVGANPRNIVRVGNRAFDYLGRISYGIYMFHMVVVYAVSWLFLQTSWWRNAPALYYAVYYALAIAGTVLLSHLSYRYFERPFLRLKQRQAPRVAAAHPAPAPEVAGGATGG